jgi:hypothetical protein
LNIVFWLYLLIGARYKGKKPHFEISIKLRIFWYPHWPTSRRKKFRIIYRTPYFLEPKRPFSQEMAKNNENRILKFNLRIFSTIQISLKYVKVPKSLDPNVLYICTYYLLLLLHIVQQLWHFPGWHRCVHNVHNNLFCCSILSISCGIFQDGADVFIMYLLTSPVAPYCPSAVTFFKMVQICTVHNVHNNLFCCSILSVSCGIFQNGADMYIMHMRISSVAPYSPSAVAFSKMTQMCT